MTQIPNTDRPIPEGSLKGQRALVIGATEGVGPEVAAALADAGVHLAVDGGDASTHKVSAPDPVDRVAEAAALLGGLDIFVHCPPPVVNKPVADMQADDLRAVVEADLVVPALQMQAAARIMAAAGYGRIIALASMSGKAGVHHNVAPYAAAKGGLLTFLRVLAAETAEAGVTVNGVATALFEPQTDTMTQEKRDRLRVQIPVGRFGRSVEAAHAVLYLASPLGGFVTGECLNLSGGRFMD